MENESGFFAIDLTEGESSDPISELVAVAQQCIGYLKSSSAADFPSPPTVIVQFKASESGRTANNATAEMARAAVTGLVRQIRFDRDLVEKSVTYFEGPPMDEKEVEETVKRLLSIQGPYASWSSSAMNSGKDWVPGGSL